MPVWKVQAFPPELLPSVLRPWASDRVTDEGAGAALELTCSDSFGQASASVLSADNSLPDGERKARKAIKAGMLAQAPPPGSHYTSSVRSRSQAKPCSASSAKTSATRRCWEPPRTLGPHAASCRAGDGSRGRGAFTHARRPLPRPRNAGEIRVLGVSHNRLPN